MDEDVVSTYLFQEDQFGAVVEERDKLREGGGGPSQPEDQSERIVLQHG